MKKNRIIYLLGGNSKRFPSNKLLYKLNGKELYTYTLDKLVRLVDVYGYELYLVTQYKDIVDSIHDHRIHVIYDTDCQYGASYSIKAALSNLEKIDGYDTFVVADTPYLSYETLDNFMKQTIQSNKLVGCVTYNQEYYNPVMFHTSLEKELLKLEKDQGGKKVFKKHLDNAYLYELMNEKETFDIDRIEDIERYINETD